MDEFFEPDVKEAVKYADTYRLIMYIKSYVCSLDEVQELMKENKYTRIEQEKLFSMLTQFRKKLALKNLMEI